MGDYQKAIESYSRVPIFIDNIGETKEKIIAATALGALYLIAGNTEKSSYLFEKALSLYDRWTDILVEKTIPRDLEIAFIYYTLFRKPEMYFKISSLKRKYDDFAKTEIKTLGNNRDIAELIYQLAKNGEHKKYEESLSNAKELLNIIDKQEGYFFDYGILQPVLRGTLLIYIGDMEAKMGRLKQASESYAKAAKITPAVKNVSLERMKSLGGN